MRRGCDRLCASDGVFKACRVAGMAGSLTRCASSWLCPQPQLDDLSSVLPEQQQCLFPAARVSLAPSAASALWQGNLGAAVSAAAMVGAVHTSRAAAWAMGAVGSSSAMSTVSTDLPSLSRFGLPIGNHQSYSSRGQMSGVGEGQRVQAWRVLA